MVEPVGRLLLASGENQVGGALLHVVGEDAYRRLLRPFVVVALTRLGVAGAIGVAVGGYLANFFHASVAHVNLANWILRMKEWLVT